MGGEKMNNQKFFGLYCGYSQEDIKQMISEIKRDDLTSLMDNYVLKKHHDYIVMEDKWEAEPPKILQGEVEKVILDAVALEYLGRKSRFKNMKALIDYMVREEEADMEEYLRNEEEWEY